MIKRVLITLATAVVIVGGASGIAQAGTNVSPILEANGTVTGQQPSHSIAEAQTKQEAKDGDGGAALLNTPTTNTPATTSTLPSAEGDLSAIGAAGVLVAGLLGLAIF